jgi:DNA repair protein RecN (Recombination protein N)
LLEDTATAATALESGAIEEAAAAAGALAGRDPGASDLAALAGELENAAHGLRRALRDYRDTLEEDPGRLAQVEERLDRIARLKRKYGATVDEVIAYGDEAQRRLALLESSDERIADLRAAEQNLVETIGTAATALSRERRDAAVELSGRLARELERLGMGSGGLAIGFACEDAADGVPAALPDYEVIAASNAPDDALAESHCRAFSETGVDRIEFLASFNAGESPRPLSTVASGGETSRFLLALTAVLGAAAEPRIIVFDEVDEGVGGRAGSLVGEALARLASRHQVLCVTHLPQVAAYGATHFVVSKEARDGTTWSAVLPVHGELRVAELAAMLGTVSDASRAAARELLAAASTPAPA